jgi:pimeloyl-ACP methyl ester carboxylesterase
VVALIALLALTAATISACKIGASRASNLPPYQEGRMNPVKPAPVVGAEVPNTEPAGELAFLGPVRRVEANGITVGYRQLGSGPPVILVVGQGSTMAMWGTELPRRLAAHHQVTMYDLRGVGYSTDPGAAPLSIGLMADDLAGLIDTLGIERPTVVGWSTGGEIALSLATRHPGKAGALLVSGATAGGPPAVQADGAADAAYRSGDLNQILDLSFTASGGTARSTYVAQVAEVANAVPDNGAALFPDEEVDTRQDLAEQAFAADTSVYNALSAIDVPTVVTNGAQDRLVPAANAELIARRIPGARLAIYGDAAHVMWFQAMDRFVGDIEQLTLAA